MDIYNETRISATLPLGMATTAAPRHASSADGNLTSTPRLFTILVANFSFISAFYSDDSSSVSPAILS